MITIADWFIPLVTLVLSGGFIGSIVAGIKNKDDDKQRLIDQLQEDREWYQEQFKERDVKIEILSGKISEMERNHIDVIHQNRLLEMDLVSERKNNAYLSKEIEALKRTIADLEKKIKILQG